MIQIGQRLGLTAVAIHEPNAPNQVKRETVARDCNADVTAFSKRELERVIS